MSERKIYCAGCNKPLGIIRDARLLKDLKFLCSACETKRLALEMQRKTKPSMGLEYLFGGIFKK